MAKPLIVKANWNIDIQGINQSSSDNKLARTIHTYNID
jgi:hypothetical protein